MSNMTISVPSDLKSRMDCFTEINWSAVAREAFDEKVKDLELIRKFKEKSTISEDDALKLGRELNKRAANKKKR